MTFLQLEKDAQTLIAELRHAYSSGRALGTFTTSIYDTAWVAMVAKHTDRKNIWLFPECFKHLLDTQLEDGSWPAYSSTFDGIINTMAAIVALKCHAHDPQGHPLYHSICLRITKAKIALDRLLQVWDVEQTVHVGFEIIVPALLQKLEQGKDPIILSFPGRQVLLGLRNKKLDSIKSAAVCRGLRTASLHSLEGLIGQISLDQVAEHRVSGSIMGSPSATAAYLMNCSTWDTDAEAYIRKVLHLGSGKGNGGVPSAFPSITFETIWALSTLLQHGFRADVLGKDQVEAIADCLQKELISGRGMLGFAPGFQVDADDTATAILCLNLLDRHVLPDEMIGHFSAGSHFKTYESERTASFSTNCNVLNMLVNSPLPLKYLDSIAEAVKYVEKCWFGDLIKDKWACKNLSPHYSMMLMARALTSLLRLSDSRISTRSLSMASLLERLPKLLTQVLWRTLSNQNPDGSWGQRKFPEEAAYGVLTLVALQKFPWMNALKAHVQTSIGKGREFLEASRSKWAHAQYLWVEKVTYGSHILSLSYCLAAMYTEKEESSWGISADCSVMAVDEMTILELVHLQNRLPSLSKEPQWKIEAALTESYFTLPELRKSRLTIFPQHDIGENKVLQFIAFVWIIAQNISLPKKTFSNLLLWRGMHVSILSVQIDAYMEGIVENFENELQQIQLLITRSCAQPMTTSHGDTTPTKNSLPERDCNLYTEESPRELSPERDLSELKEVLNRIVNHVLCNRETVSSSDYLRNLVRYELEKYLLANITQARENFRFRQQENGCITFRSPSSSFYKWISNTSADHSTLPFAMAFFCSFIDHDSRIPLLAGARQKYLFEDVCRHLARMTRLFNDYGSIDRDKIEGTVNSVNFPEFQLEAQKQTIHQCGDSGRKLVEAQEEVVRGNLFWVASYERKCLDFAMGELEMIVDHKVADGIKLFATVADIFAQIYVVKDIGLSVADLNDR